MAKWVDVDKGRGGEALIRSRLVARDFKAKNDDRDFAVFVATLPLETNRLFFRMSRVRGSMGDDEKNRPVKLVFIDVKKDHLNGEVAQSEGSTDCICQQGDGGEGRRVGRGLHDSWAGATFQGGG